MKSKKIVTLLLFILISLGILLNVTAINTYAAENSIVVTEKPYTAYTLKNIKVRSKTSSSSKIIEKVESANKITVICKEKGNWIRIKTSSGKIGYITKNNITTEKPYKAYTLKNIKVRSETKGSSKCIEKVESANKVIVICKEKGNWIRIKTPSGNIGYITKNNITTEKPYKAYTLKNIKVRSETKGSSKCIEKVESANKVIVICKEKGNWIRIKTSSGNIGYITKDNITKEKPYTAYILKNLTVKSETKSSSKDIEKLEYANEITVICKEKGNWIRIKTSSGKIGYISKKKITTKKLYSTRKGYVSVINGVYLRKTKNDNGKKIIQMKPGEKVTIQNKENGWYKIKTSSGKLGYVRTKYISTKDPKKAVLLTTYTTYSRNSPSGRNYNIARASNKISGKILKPGESFNWKYVVGRCDKSTGYRQATVIISGKYVQDYGGGVCQVATTLCGCVQSLGIKPTEKHKHSAGVSYLNGDGVEAAVSYGSKNFRFTNTTKKTIQLEFYTGGGRIIVAAYEIK